MLKYVTTLVLNLVIVCECMRNNVCKSFEDYKTIQFNPNCWYNPDVGASPREIVERYGFNFEYYEIKTRDGYIVSLFRIPNNGSDIERKRPVAFVQHGIAADGASWMLLGPKSIVFVLANSGYDVWISNCRGTEYASKHVKYSLFSPEYWNFSFHEMGLYDVSAMLEFIVDKTNQRGNITYIGHSMGSTMCFVYASLLPEEAKSNLKSIIALAPVAYMDHFHPIGKALARHRNLIWQIFTTLGIYGIGSNLQFKLNIMRKLCSSTPLIIICAAITGLASGYNMNETNPSVFPLGSIHYPSGFSMKTVLHYAQIASEKKKFQQFDYGPEINLKLYNSSKPPEYPLPRINVPVHLFYGNRDVVSREKDVLYLYEKLQTEKTIMEVSNFAHLDFLSGLHAFDFYQNVLTLL